MRSPAWKRKREQAFNHYGKKCYACGTRRGPLHIHHITYVRLFREQMRDLRPLCMPCHREVTRLHWKMGKRKVTGEVVFNTFMKNKKRA
jgi:5-methylcytosine-specific restriction endonuclease McrA